MKIDNFWQNKIWIGKIKIYLSRFSPSIFQTNKKSNLVPHPPSQIVDNIVERHLQENSCRYVVGVIFNPLRCERVGILERAKHISIVVISNVSNLTLSRLTMAGLVAMQSSLRILISLMPAIKHLT